MRKIFFFIPLIAISVYSKANLVGDTSETFLVKHRPEYMLPSPEAISKIKHIARPPALYTGITDITVPLWNNSICNYAINLKYYAGGIQVNELASSVGLGWSLEVGGAITRVVRGLPDDLPEKGFLNLSSGLRVLYNLSLDKVDSLYNVGFNLYDETYNCSSIDINTLNNIGDLYDPSPDIFYYDFNGYKGKFIFNYAGEIIAMPKTNLIITAERNEIGEIVFFTFRTSDGVVYTFSVPERITINSCGAELIDPNNILELGYTSYISAWHLTDGKRISNGEVSYEYNTVITNHIRNLYEYQYFDQSENLVTELIQANITIERPQIKSISDVNSITKFNYGDNNELLSISVSGVYPDKTSIEVNKVLDIQFNYGEFLSQTTNIERKRKLVNIKMGTISVEDVFNLQNEYSFTYNTLELPTEYSLQQDLWGYYNGSAENTLLPQLYYHGIYECLDLNITNIPGVNRNVNPEYIEAGMLMKIENSLGGITEFDYEPQSFLYNNTTVLGGGLRIKSIKSYDPSSDLNEKVVNYSYTIFNDSLNVSTGLTPY